MNEGRPALADKVLALLRTIAPEIEPATIDPRRPLRRQIDLDSMDWLNFLAALSASFGVEIPESDDDRLRTLAGILDYLETRSSG